MSNSIGPDPIEDRSVVLSQRCDWGHDFFFPRGKMAPPGTVGTLEFGADPDAPFTVWPALAITQPSNVLSFRATAVQTTPVAIPDRTAYRIYVVVPQPGGGTRKSLWFVGEVRRVDGRKV